MSHSVRKLLHFSAEIFPHAPRLCDLAEFVICAPSPYSASMRGLKIDYSNLFSSDQREPYGASRCPQQSS
jgi:predicted transcriptional regulator with HTH domain